MRLKSKPSRIRKSSKTYVFSKLNFEKPPENDLIDPDFEKLWFVRKFSGCNLSLIDFLNRSFFPSKKFREHYSSENFFSSIYQLRSEKTLVKKIRTWFFSAHETGFMTEFSSKNLFWKSQIRQSKNLSRIHWWFMYLLWQSEWEELKESCKQIERKFTRTNSNFILTWKSFLIVLLITILKSIFRWYLNFVSIVIDFYFE